MRLHLSQFVIGELVLGVGRESVEFAEREVVGVRVGAALGAEERRLVHEAEIELRQIGLGHQVDVGPGCGEGAGGDAEILILFGSGTVEDRRTHVLGVVALHFSADRLRRRRVDEELPLAVPDGHRGDAEYDLTAFGVGRRSLGDGDDDIFARHERLTADAVRVEREGVEVAAVAFGPHPPGFVWSGTGAVAEDHTEFLRLVRSHGALAGRVRQQPLVVPIIQCGHRCGARIGLARLQQPRDVVAPRVLKARFDVVDHIERHGDELVRAVERGRSDERDVLTPLGGLDGGGAIGQRRHPIAGGEDDRAARCGRCFRFEGAFFNRVLAVRLHGRRCQRTSGDDRRRERARGSPCSHLDSSCVGRGRPGVTCPVARRDYHTRRMRTATTKCQENSSNSDGDQAVACRSLSGSRSVMQYSRPAGSRMTCQ